MLIFTAFADTAKYLYANLAPILDQYHVKTAMVSGSTKPQSNNRHVDAEFNSILSAFSPNSKLKKT